jgi:hypothetical protein
MTYVDDYTPLETAVRDEIYSHFGQEFDHNDQVVAGAVDLIFKQLIGENKKYGCLMEFGGGARTRVEPFKQFVWQWTIISVFMLRYTGKIEEVETELRQIVDKLAVLFKDDHTLGGLTPWVRVERIDQPEVVTMNDVPMYWIPFEVSVIAGPI